MYEIELKFPLENPKPILAKLSELDAHPGELVRQRDLYLRHPSRDFTQTHEALRLRTTGGELCITYKGPILDSQVKVRREIEVLIGRDADEAAIVEELFALLGFVPVRAVEKSRRTYSLNWENRSLEIMLDTVDGLGTYLEMEGLAEEPEREAVRDSLLRLSNQLGLENPERKSYLRLLMEQGAD